MSGQSFLLKLSAVMSLGLLAMGARAQQTTGQATIDVVTVKPHPAAVMHNNFAFKRNRFELEDQPMLKLIAFAYGLNAKQVVGAPRWVGDERWDISGTTNLTDDATFLQEQQLIQQMLSERFGFKFHHEQREMSAFALRVVKGQPMLAATKNPASQPIEHTEGRDGRLTENYTASSISYFLTIRQLFMDRALVDETGLKGSYDFKLTYGTGDSPSSDADAPLSMFTAIKEQLGLKFEPVKTAVDVMVVDNIELPSAN